MVNGRIVEAVSGPELDRHLRAIARTVRLSGTPGEAEAFDYLEQTLHGFGFRVERHESEGLIGYPLRSTFAITEPEHHEMACNGYALTPATEAAGVEAELVHVGSSLQAGYEGLDTRGKIVVCDGIAIEDAALAAARAGAIGQIFVNPEHIHEMCISPVWGTPIPETAHLLPSVPAVGIARADGERLKALMARGPVRARLTTQPYRAWTKIPTLTAELPGRRATTSCSSAATSIPGTTGRWTTAPPTRPRSRSAGCWRNGGSNLRRGVRLAFWSGHSHGRYAGSTWYADTFWHDLHERCVCHVNVDSVGARGATILDATSSMAETYPFAREVLPRRRGPI